MEQTRKHFNIASIVVLIVAGASLLKILGEIFFGEFYEKTCLFTRALKESTLPAPVLDAVSANLSVLKSPLLQGITRSVQ